MRTKTQRLIAVIVVLAALCSVMMPVFATNTDSGISPQASYYINAVSASASGGTGSITVYFNIAATGKMTSLGAQSVLIYNSAGTLVKSFYASSTTGMLASDRYSYSSSVTYNGATSGARYYAVVTFEASNSSGGDSTKYTTSYATAK